MYLFKRFFNKKSCSFGTAFIIFVFYQFKLFFVRFKVSLAFAVECQMFEE